MKLIVTKALDKALTTPESKWTDSERRAMCRYEAAQVGASVRSHNKARKGSHTRSVEITLCNADGSLYTPVVVKSEPKAQTSFFLSGVHSSNCPKCNSRFFKHYVRRSDKNELLDLDGNYFGSCPICKYDYKPE